MTVQVRRYLCLLVLAAVCLGAPGGLASVAQPTVAFGRAAPPFSLPTAGGPSQSLAEYRGRPVALFFFCGCPWCRGCARVWGRFQRGGALAPSSSALLSPITLVVFSGGAGEARAFASATGLDMGQTVLLLDPNLRVTQAVYRATPCPRAFVLDASGRLRYTNDHADDAPRTAPALAIASRALTALRATEVVPESKLMSVPNAKPGLSATTPDGRPVNLAARPGWKVVYFWSGACPCVQACERYSFVPLANEYRGRVAFYGVASDGWDLTLPRPQLMAQIKAHRLPFPVLLDTRHRIAQTLGARVTPQTFVLDPRGRVVFAGMPDDSRRYLWRPGPRGERVAHTYLSVALAQALSGRPVTPAPLPEAGCIIAW